MPKLYRIIVIDPLARCIEEVQSTATLDAIRDLVGAGSLDHFRIADHGDSWDDGWCDDLGLAREQPVHAFMFGIREDPIAGRCVLLGTRKEGGGVCDARFPIGLLRQEVTWLGMIWPQVRWVETEHGEASVVSFTRLS